MNDDRAPLAGRRLTDELGRGLDSPICLTWEVTYGCNLACVHCLSSSGRRDPRELSTAEALGFIDELAAMRVFYINVGGGEPMLRPDFFDLVEHATRARIGVKFSTNGTLISESRARRIASMDYVDVQVSVDGARPHTNDPVRGVGTFEAALTALRRLSMAGFGGLKLSAVVTRLNVGELDDLLGLASRYGAQLRLARLRPAGRGAKTWHDLRPTARQLVELHSFLVEHPEVLTGDSFFHLGALGEPLAGLNMCGAGRVVCLVDPVGDVYACPFVMHGDFRAGSVRDPGGFAQVWRGSVLFTELREPVTGGACNACGAFDSCHGGCMAAKFFTGLPLDGPDPECVLGHGQAALGLVDGRKTPDPGIGHSRLGSVPVVLGARQR